MPTRRKSVLSGQIAIIHKDNITKTLDILYMYVIKSFSAVHFECGERKQHVNKHDVDGYSEKK